MSFLIGVRPTYVNMHYLDKNDREIEYSRYPNFDWLYVSMSKRFQALDRFSSSNFRTKYVGFFDRKKNKIRFFDRKI